VSESPPSDELSETAEPPRGSLLKKIAYHHLWQLLLGISVIIGTLATVIAYRHDLCQFSGICSLPAPATLSFSDRDTHPLDGYRLISNVDLPTGLVPGRVLPGGARARIVIQAADSNRVVEIDRINIVAVKLPSVQEFPFNYTFDTVGQSGFGVVQPRQFNVILRADSAPKVYYISQDGPPQSVSDSNVLPPDIPVLVLDAQAGLQEVLDFNISPADPGIYEIKFYAHLIAAGRSYTVQTIPIYAVKK
jgi:hypothetical protein